MLDQLGDGGIAEAEGSVEGDTLHGGAGDGDLAPCSSDGGEVFGLELLNLLEDVSTSGLVLLAGLLDDQIVDFLVGVSVVHEVTIAEERGQVVVRVGVVREPSKLVDRVHTVGIVGNHTILVVLGPFGGLQVDLEQAACLKLGLQAAYSSAETEP